MTTDDKWRNSIAEIKLVFDDLNTANNKKLIFLIHSKIIILKTRLNDNLHIIRKIVGTKSSIFKEYIDFDSYIDLWEKSVSSGRLGPDVFEAQFRLVQVARNEFLEKFNALIEYLEYNEAKFIDQKESKDHIINWIEMFNRLFDIINEEGDNYFSGPRFINITREINQHFPNYSQYIEAIRQSGKSTSRRDYFQDIIFSFDQDKRLRIFKKILNDVRPKNHPKAFELKNLVNGTVTSPKTKIRDEIWSADRLNQMLDDIDSSITKGEHERAITLSYSCLEGFFKAFIKQNIPNKKDLKDLIEMSKEIQKYLKNIVKYYPDEALKLINHIAHTVEKSRDNFSESHFGEEAEKWLSTFVRDCVNSEIRLLLSFM